MGNNFDRVDSLNGLTTELEALSEDEKKAIGEVIVSMGREAIDEMKQTHDIVPCTRCKRRFDCADAVDDDRPLTCPTCVAVSNDQGSEETPATPAQQNESSPN
jgi:hypothetical protein